MQDFRLFLFFLFVSLSSMSPLRAGPSAFLDKGVESFATGDYKQAVDAFTEAEKESPNDLRISYNLGSAQAAAGNFADAVSTLRKSALSKDTELAAQSLILIGDIAVAQAKALLAPKAEETPPHDRPSIFDLLAVAERSFSEAIELRPSEAEPLRRNLERIRAWKHRIESDWNLADREKKRKELELPQRFDWLEQWERNLRTGLKRTVLEKDSPRKFQMIYELSKEQQRFREELSPLKESLRQAIPDDSAAPFVAAIDKISESVGAANDALREAQGKSALEAATTIVEGVDYLKSRLSSFEAIVQNGVKKQESLCKENPSVPINEESGEKSVGPPEIADLDEQAWEQEFVAVWMPLMLDKAKQESPPSDTPEAKQQTENLQKAKELAIQYGPEIESLAADAVKFLREKNPENALPKQNRALELLREIFKPLQQDQEQKQKQDQKQDEEKKQDQEQKQDEEKKQDQNQQQDEKDSKEQQERPEQKENEASEQNRDSSGEKKADEKELTPQEKKEEFEKAQRMLRQAKRRQQEADEKREKVRALLMQLEPVEKDW